MFSKNGIELIRLRYQHKGESIEEVFKRVAKAISVRDEKFEKELYDLMITRTFFPNSPCIRNAGRKRGVLHACLSRDTEVLTKKGWKNYDQYINEEVLTFNARTEEMSFQKPINKVDYMTEKMIGFKTKILDILVTPNHQMLYKYRSRQGKYFNKKIDALSLSTLKKRKAIYTSGQYIFPIKSIDLSLADCELLGWIFTDGHLAKGAIGHKNDEIIISQTNQCLELEECLNKTGTKWTKSGIAYRIWAGSARKYRQYFNTDKTLKWDLIYFLSKEQLTSLWKGIYYGDAQKRNSTSYAIHQKNFIRRDQIQIIAILLGKRAHYSVSTRGNNVINISDIKRHTWFTNNACSEINYNGIVWCVQVPNENILIRHNGKIAIVGNCFVLPCEDNMTGIFDTVKNMANIFKFGGGCGINFSALRPKGADLSSGGTSSGAISFMRVFDVITETVKQGGFRRGALMGILNPTHPEILDFCRAKLKGDLTNFNLSVLVTDKFMKKATNSGSVELVHEGKIYNKIRARDILDLIALGTWVNGDPGLLFFDRINKDNPLKEKGIWLDTTNPCSEVALPPFGACTLGSINLSKFVEGTKFDFDKFEVVVRSVARALLHINIIGHYPLPQIRELMLALNPIGIGLMGFADALIMLGIKYDSEDCLDFIHKLSIPYIRASNEVAPDSFYRRIIAPTGSLSILADCSFSIEPIYAKVYERHITTGTIVETKPIYDSEYCRTAHEVSPDWHLKVQAAFQDIVDGGVSKTVNVSNNTSVDEIKKIYIKAWRAKVKGVTIYRDGSTEGVLQAKTKCEEEVCHL